MSRPSFALIITAGTWMPGPSARAEAPGLEVHHPPLAPLDGAVLRLDQVVLAIVEANPALRAARERAAVALARQDGAGRMPDLEVVLEQLAAPLARPWALDEASMLRVGLVQRIPPPGTLGAQARAADAALAGERAVLEMSLEDLVLAARRAFFAYYAADRVYRIHVEHVELTQQVVEVARAHYVAGRISQSEVLRTVVALSRVHRALSDVEEQRLISQARLSSLIGDRPDRALPPPEEPALPSPASLARMERDLDRRPDLEHARQALEESGAILAGAEAAARWPSLAVGAGYVFMPQESRHAWSAMISVSLPWLSGRASAEARAAERGLAASDAALEAARLEARYQLAEALARRSAAEESFAILDHDLLAQSRQSFDAAQARFAGGQQDALGILDALGALLEVRIEHLVARARLCTAHAEVERAAGVGRRRGSVLEGGPGDE